MLTQTFRMAALAFSNPAKIGANTDYTQVDKGADQCLNHLVIEVATKKRMGMSNDGKPKRWL